MNSNEEPWSVGPPHVVRRVTRDAEGRRITEFIAEACGPTPEVAEERARMLSALPDFVSAVRGLLEIAETAMPDTYFASDSRVRAARLAFAKAGIPLK